MSSNEIGTNVIFKKQLGLNYEIDQKYVGLKMKENNVLSFNFRVPGALIDEVDKEKKSPLMYACMAGRLDCAVILKESHRY